MSIACGNHEAGELFLALRERLPTQSWKLRRTRGAALIEFRNREIGAWLVEHFGHLAHGKRLPAWALGMEESCREALLDGYTSADGHETYRSQQTTSVSKVLSVGVRLLATSLGHHTSMTLRLPSQMKDRIEGRLVNLRPSYGVRWTLERKRFWATEIDGVVWSRVDSSSKTGKVEPVFNLQVEEDESYTVDGLVVHNCTHHSRARGGAPKNDQSRATAWHVLNWCSRLRVKDVLVENVKEFADWGPMDEHGKSIKSRKGEVFRAWIGALHALGYNVEWRVLCSADYGDPTSRERLFVRARLGNKPIVWPRKTHVDPKLLVTGLLPPDAKPWRTAREIIDWSIPGKSIFGRKKPLAPNTLRRIAAGLEKFGGPNAEPFLVMLYGTGKTRSIDRPMPAVTANGQHVGLAEPVILTPGGANLRNGAPIDSPLPTVMTKDRFALAEPFLVGTSFTGANGKQYWPLERPLPTVMASGRAFGLVDPFLVPYYGTGAPDSVDEPLATVTTKGRFGLVQQVRLDIRFRMLRFHELSAAMGFPAEYDFAGDRQEDLVKQVGNAVSVGVARALCASAIGG